MASCSYRDMEKVCKALGLKNRGYIWKGTANGGYRRISLHTHAGGRNIDTGLFHAYVKDLGFESVDEFFRFLDEI